MAKLLFTGSLICVSTLLLGSYLFPHSILMELASTSLIANIFRGIVGLVLISVLVTSPPRGWALRIGMGACAIALLGVGIAISFSNGMHLLDAILYLQLGCALGIEALEFNEDELLAQAASFQNLNKSNASVAK